MLLEWGESPVGDRSDVLSLLYVTPNSWLLRFCNTTPCKIVGEMTTKWDSEMKSRFMKISQYEDRFSFFIFMKAHMHLVHIHTIQKDMPPKGSLHRHLHTHTQRWHWSQATAAGGDLVVPLSPGRRQDPSLPQAPVVPRQETKGELSPEDPVDAEVKPVAPAWSTSDPSRFGRFTSLVQTSHCKLKTTPVSYTWILNEDITSHSEHAGEHTAVIQSRLFMLIGC